LLRDGDIAPGLPVLQGDTTTSLFAELDHFLHYEVDTEEGMTLDMMEGALQAIAVGPSTIQPKPWLPRAWVGKELGGRRQNWCQGHNRLERSPQLLETKPGW
jgi:uncharacterized protein YecA (UPF0149 family)